MGISTYVYVCVYVYQYVCRYVYIYIYVWITVTLWIASSYIHSEYEFTGTPVDIVDISHVLQLST